MGAAKKDNSENPTGQEIPAGGSAMGSAVDQSVGTIREIIFGEQMRATEARFEALEKKVQERAETVLANLVERIAELDTSLRKDLKELKSNLEQTSAANTKALEKSSSDLSSALEAAVSQLQSEKTDRFALSDMLSDLAAKLKA